MATQSTRSRRPSWTGRESRLQAFLRGIAEAPSISVLVVVITFVGFGALARDVGLNLGQAIFVSATVFALPGQIVLVDQVGQGVTLAAAFFAVTLTAIRLLPLTTSLMPYLRDGITPSWQEYIFAHIIAVTIWIESMRRLPLIPVELRVPYYAGFGGTLFTANLIATMLGFSIASVVPIAITAALIFLTPIYFFLSMIAASRNASDALALGVGFVMGPALFLVIPGFDLVITGIAGGSFAYGIVRWREARG